MIPIIGLDRASSPYPAALMKTFRKNKEKCASPYDVSPCRNPVVAVNGLERS